MSMRQYVGARYVPKFYVNSQDPSSIEWENTEYEPLTIVSWLNNTYISRTAVPINAGNPPMATSYWVLFGFASGQIAQLQADKLDKYSVSHDDWDTVPTENSTNAITSDAVYDATFDKVPRSVTSPFLETPGELAVSNHSKDTFIYGTDNKYYRVTDSISVGVSYIEPGVNCEETTIGNELFYLIRDKLQFTVASSVREAIGTTPTASHAIGTVFMCRDGNLYRATAAITSGVGTITVGGNCTLTTISDELKNIYDYFNGDQSAVTVPANMFSDVNVNRVDLTGKLVTINFHAYFASPVSGSNTTIATLPAKFRPSSTNKCTVIGTYNSNFGLYLANINTNGEINVATGSNNFTGAICINAEYEI